MRVKTLETPHKSSRKRMHHQIEMAVIHYTGSLSLTGTLDWFSDVRSKVSAHFVLGRGGEVYAYEELRSKLWHAGKSEWNGRKWCNNYSVGYELVGTFDSGFTEAQMDNLLELLYRHTASTGIKAIVGHEHISTGRKVDPGPQFNWDLVRTSHRETPLLNIHGKPIEFIGAYPVIPPKPKVEIEAGANGMFFTPTSQRILRLLRIGGRG
jgi:N-acetyl-anhydromuramyl-L-alanine amidase AmpD